MMTKLQLWARAVAQHEGYNIKGSIAQRFKNPGNIIFGPLAQSFGSTTYYTHPTTKHQFSIFPTDEQGFGALEKLLKNAATGVSKVYNPEMTIIEFCTKYSPVRDKNGKVIPNLNYAKSIAYQIGVPMDTKIKYLIDKEEPAPTPTPTPVPPVVEPTPSKPSISVYYSQNDPRWKTSPKMGPSSCTLGQFGCTTSCIADGGQWFGENKTPAELATSLSYTRDGLIIWQSIEKVYKRMKFYWRFYRHDESLITEALKNPEKVVLLNVDRGYHWVFLLGKVPFLGYRCSDPYPFPSKVRYYKASEVSGGAILTKK